jgi:hypothetical protein
VQAVVSVGVLVMFDLSVGSLAGESLNDVAGFNGVRKGDLKGLWSVFEASFSLRRFA